MDKKRRSTAARWIFYPVLIGAIIYLVISQNQDRQAPEKKEYNSQIETKQREITVQEGDRFPLRFKMANRGKMAWRSEGEFPCFLSYHLYSRENMRTIRYDNRRFSLPQQVEPGQKIEMEIILTAPLEAGGYLLQFDMVREGKAWFRDYGARTEFVRLTVEKKEWPEDSHPFTLEYGKYTVFHSGSEELNKLLKIIRLTLDKNEVAYVGKTGKINGFSAGENYPQIWLRDANTIIPASRYFYEPSYFSSWLEEHLAFQDESGSLEDWIDSRGKSDKNTTETDQESSAVQAAGQTYQLFGPDWLEKPVAGRKIIDRLEQALLFLLHNRWSKAQGLLRGAHTADWGDVDLIDKDQEAIYTDERTHWTVDIYDQSMFYLACLNLSEMMEALGDTERSAFWKERARSIKKNTDRWLWQKDKGFYKVHIHLDELEHEFDESDIFAMGGNAQAIISGLADEEKSHRIIEEALKRQEIHDVSTISGTLLPPYPKGLFKHPLLDDPYEYQNGAQWDWFGGRLIYAMFENGYSRTALQKFFEIIRKNLKNQGFFEWDNKKGVGRGSDFYAGSAGSLGKALFEGYFGIKLKNDYLSIEPKIDEESAKIHVFQPATDTFIAYEYDFDKQKNKIILRYNSNFVHHGTLKILIPHTGISDKSARFKDNFEVQIDGKPTEFGLETRINDSFVVINSDFRNHVAEIFIIPFDRN